ncbi:DNA integrity scanning diadenylate cyclase DisA [Bacillus sp. Marseille-P3661]|uniref:DNA integrity scanning diadenylate cyclase DisA n=1 Tax=Bacillus sp. Marseille-P3661 TaxID=1936234 RepID=UPI000C860223|nr:DNA integrity scanning diadenylate cyclase DisA [Bacillus sp. Marseille-P3661]
MGHAKQNGNKHNEILNFVSPGSPIREGIDNVLRANTGGLIVIGYNEKVREVIDGGFTVNCIFSPAYLYELAKMDGAIILNDTGTKILYANTQLIPSSGISSIETGMRHRTAERVAKQTGCLVIAISQRRNVITLYQGDFRYALRQMGEILTKANQAIQTLEKYKSVLDQGITNLGALEMEELVTLQDVIQVIHRVEMVLRIKQEIQNYIIELGTEGRLITLQLNELVSNIEEEIILLIKDYSQYNIHDSNKLASIIQVLSEADLLDDEFILELLGYESKDKAEDLNVCPRGYRILYKIPRLPQGIIHNLVSRFHNLNAIMRASILELVSVEGIGDIRAKKIKEGLERIQEQLLIDRHI